eukprot:CAMPEP_0198234332 /NCGR_PEP_ID=MMETSP1446-20131203/374_1 /TAXON_ID=1461542 ORGANISM="Unidentified sp, Strain CCMP2111" /NCGR_SAMPLE_ID=MMETSP1446 /ASSEMBLY_ACC=CAM_ASM_001112 /LENGTH=128 /DNA_ID=CAMNT_0043915097 /DNA_START=119 /DNA_END=505 /DNA_ORIENTATION=+
MEATPAAPDAQVTSGADHAQAPEGHNPAPEENNNTAVQGGEQTVVKSEDADANTKPAYDNPDLGNTAEAAALNVTNQLNLQALPIRQYLESTVVSLLVNGLTQLVKVRPDDPVEYLAAYLLKNNPKKK